MDRRVGRQIEQGLIERLVVHIEPHAGLCGLELYTSMGKGLCAEGPMLYGFPRVPLACEMGRVLPHRPPPPLPYSHSKRFVDRNLVFERAALRSCLERA